MLRRAVLVTRGGRGRDMAVRMNTMKVADLVENVRVGSTDWGWHEEYEDLWERDIEGMDILCASIEREGILNPVLVGDDGRLWDGHHRVVAALALGIPEIPTISWEDLQ